MDNPHLTAENKAKLKSDRLFARGPVLKEHKFTERQQEAYDAIMRGEVFNVPWGKGMGKTYLCLAINEDLHAIRCALTASLKDEGLQGLSQGEIEYEDEVIIEPKPKKEYLLSAAFPASPTLIEFMKNDPEIMKLVKSIVAL